LACGGEGIERDVEMLEDVTVSLITERRTSAPWGLAGGGPGAVGENWLGAEPLSDKCTVRVPAGGVVRVLTPGGGGWGRATPATELIVLGGRDGEPIVIADYSPAWVERFELERGRLAAALGAVAVRIDHVGSTAVPGLGAKPIVDVLVAVPDPGDDAAFVPALTAAGYVLRVIEPGHRMFRTPDREVHVHLWATESVDERRQLLFRDWLRVDAHDRELYERVKRQLAERPWHDHNDYADAKTDVVTVILNRAEEWAAQTGWTA
jgi:GrpB-like predicted nucleotidyltransferase (UPF0157 family)